MSAYVLNNNTINRIVAGIESAMQNGSYSPNRPPPDLPAYIACNFNPSKFGRKLYEMNVKAVNARYPDTVNNPDAMPGLVDANGRHVSYKYAPAMPPTKYQFYKDLETYLYQCTEGDVPSRELYKAVESYKNRLACWIVSNSQEYYQTRWD